MIENNTQNKNRKTIQKNVLLMLLLGIFLGILLVVFRRCIMEPIYGPASISLIRLFIIFFVGVYGGCLVQAILHEAGHLLFGRLTGYRFSSIRIGTRLWVRMHGRIFMKRFTMPGTGGQCLMDPPDLKDGKMPYVLYNAGGILVNLISMPIFFLIAVLLFGVSPTASLIFLLFGALGLIFAIQNGIPRKTEWISTDGYNLRVLKQHPESLRAFWVQLKAKSQSAHGEPTYTMPDEWFVMPPKEQWTDIFQSSLVILSAQKLMDRRRYREARQKILELLQMENITIGIQRCLLLLECAFCEMVSTNDSEIVEKCLAEIPERFLKTMNQYPPVIRVQYAYALLQKKDEMAAEELMEQFNDSAYNYPYNAEIFEERVQMEYVSRLAEMRADED